MMIKMMTKRANTTNMAINRTPYPSKNCYRPLNSLKTYILRYLFTNSFSIILKLAMLYRASTIGFALAGVVSISKFLIFEIT